MGTNFYHITNECRNCGRRDEKHIGKSSKGWTFSFQGYKCIRSFADWLDVFNVLGGSIFDEFGNQWTIATFEKLVNSKKDEPKSMAKEVEKGVSHFYWLDEDDNSFTDHEFS